MGEVSTLEMRRMETLDEVAAWQRKVQKIVMENSAHRIPAIFHMEGLCGAFIQDSTSFPSGIGRGASFDPKLEEQIADITYSIEAAKEEAGQQYTVKQMEKTKKTLKAKLEKLNDQTRKDDVVTFEQLGVDRLFVDESHYYKNLFLYTKMRNVAGISQTDAQKSSDMFMKCRYMDEITGGKGITFATGTPVSNSMTELYTIMRYLQYDTLMNMGMGHFDSWAATFGETVTAIELSPEGYTLIGQKN